MSGSFKFAGMLLVVGAVVFLASTPMHARPQNQPHRNAQSAPNGQRGQANPRMGDWLRSNQGKSFAQQKQSLENDPDFKKLTPERQQELQQRLQKFNNLPPDQQQRILERIDKFNRMSPQQRAQARALLDRMRTLPEERRNLIRQQIHALVGMTPDQRQRFMSSEQFDRQYSPDEREMMTRALELNDQIPAPTQ
ncbi:MAG TPA: DUF3106 domain-containing protein [Terriglobales bacterium]|nr:DUF3106 domain-containing protein [Terriglobales bacterium]